MIQQLPILCSFCTQSIKNHLLSSLNGGKILAQHKPTLLSAETHNTKDADDFMENPASIKYGS